MNNKTEADLSKLLQCFGAGRTPVKEEKDRMNLFLLIFRQMLMNQAELLLQTHNGNGYRYANDSNDLARRITELVGDESCIR